MLTTNCSLNTFFNGAANVTGLSVELQMQWRYFSNNTTTTITTSNATTIITTSTTTTV